MSERPVFTPGDLTEAGSWQIVVYPADQKWWPPPMPTAPGVRPPVGSTTPVPLVNQGHDYSRGNPLNITVFRGVPTQIGSMGTADPFGPTVAQLTFPAITILDALGAGDLAWLCEESDVDLMWVAPDGTVLMTWEGYFHSFAWGEDESSSSLTVTCNGAMKQMDNYLAKPEYLYQPLPYEVAITRQFSNRHDSRMQAMDPPSSCFPSWWTTTFTRSKYSATQPWLLPSGVLDGQKWSGMLTRETGHFEPVLTNYIQGLLANMYTERGQFTLMLDRGRKPVLRHRDHLTVPGPDTLVVDVLWQGVTIAPSMDYSQKIGVIYGQGRATNGDTFSGMEVTADGSSTYYDPMAYDPAVHPVENNPLLNGAIMRKEVSLQYNDGLTALEARKAAQAHRANFSDPGITGQITLKIDPRRFDNGDPVPRATITAGRSILVKGLFGRDDGILFHITETSVGFDLTMILTVDTKFRDALTVDQVRRRTKDALVPFRMMSTTNTFDPKIPDLLYPWNYSKGAGVIPRSGAPLFTTYGPRAVGAAGVVDPRAIPFPWTEYTTAFPPRKYPQFYAAVQPKNRLADLNWANSKYKKGLLPNHTGYAFVPYPVVFAAAGSIRMIQFAAYDKNGNVKKVPFHVSLYAETMPTYTHMPMIPQYAPTRITNTATLIANRGSKVVGLRNLPRGHGISKGMNITVYCSRVPAASGTWKVTAVGSNWCNYQTTHAATSTGRGTAKINRPTPQPYPAGQHYPFFPGAWEKINDQGQSPTTLQPQAAANMLMGWGTSTEKAGYWPGVQADAAPTGLLVDETPFPFDFRNGQGGVNIYDTPAHNQATPARVTGWAMIYCDADAADSTYFLGRLFRQDYLNA